jgi:carbamoyl-phosphate synthase large subunit
VTIKKLALSRLGKAVAACVVDDPEAAEVAVRLVRALRWEGPLELELMRETSSGRLHVIEVNARFPAWVAITAGAGVNLPDLLLRQIMGEDFPVPGAPRAGTLFVRTSRTTLREASALGELLSTGSLLRARKVE